MSRRPKERYAKTSVTFCKSAALSAANPALSSPSWYALDPLWQGGETVARRGLPHSQLAPAWQMLLLGDGSPTRHLRLLTGEAIAVDVIDMCAIGAQNDGAPDIVRAVQPPRIRRQVWLRTASGQRLAYAVSWWEAARIEEYFQDRSLPIWDNLTRLHAELYRDIQGICYGRCAALETAFQEEGPFWGRYYLFWHDRHPLTLIYEVFSPHLREYLGPSTRECNKH